jgi:galactonate dehydratase
VAKQLKITGLETTPLSNRGMLLRMLTDEGLVGLGSPMNYEHGRTVARAIDDMGEYLIGRDPLQIEDHWQTLFRSSYSRQMPILLSALSGIEMACWDLLGKRVGLPVWKLLGGSVRDAIRVYGGAGGATPEDAAASARRSVEAGFTAVKTTPFPRAVRPIETPAEIRRVVKHIAAIREAIGESVDLAIDFHRAASPPFAKMLLRELEPFHPLFVEEPTKAMPDNVGPLRELAQSTCIPLATGERCTTRWGFRELCETKAAAIIQPDIRHCGGIREMRHIAAMAEVHEILVAPHSAADPLGIVAAAHAMAPTPNFLLMEFGGGGGTGFFTEPLSMVDGFIQLPQGPGLGVEIDPEGLEKMRQQGTWRQRTMRRHPEDGNFSDF